MKTFLDDNFLLHSKTAERLYHEYASHLPIIDYHCHLPPEQLAQDLRFENLSQAWLAGDHYKWRAMRANGVAESYCTGSRPDRDKFRQWAATVPYTLRNPLFHWTHLELQRYFGVRQLLNPDTADAIYDTCSAMLQTEGYSVRNLLRRMKVAVVGTTDDPADNLAHHRQIRDDGFEIPILPSFRPDKAMQVDHAAAFNAYILRIESASNRAVGNLQQYLDALKQRHDFFAAMGCTVSDHGLEQMEASDFTETAAAAVFNRLRCGHDVGPSEQSTFRSYMLHQFAVWDWEKGWVQQYHLGALRNNNTRRLRQLGPDTGWDSIGDFAQARSLSRFLDGLDQNNQLAKTILYNLNPADNELMAAMIGNFNDGSCPGKIQLGSGWWFMDQKDGMTRQIDALSNMGLLSRFVGMITDSRSFLSYPRHEYFRRILCNLLSNDIEQGELPNDLAWTGKVVQDICYHNARNYFNWQPLSTPAVQGSL